ncbi:MAG: DUF1553 domain-containing protein [Verrucomicrobia bacterium]|nr:DUF1553 domain-containing protein [Verrucomicrobiota bacterium]
MFMRIGISRCIALIASVLSVWSTASEPILPDSPAAPTNHWAFQPLADKNSPAVSDSAWPLNSIDRFILAKLEQHQLQPAPPADAATLCRRLYFDLTGLPPSPAELTAFERSAAAHRQAATANLVEHLLASPRFGERWGRHWLDVARYGESLTLRGFIFREAWRYRDYVIESFNRDTPFDQFIREQIAGDLLPYDSRDQHHRQRVAASFLALGNTNLEEQDKKQLDMDVVDEQLDTVGKAFLGLAIGCARCHDHKFDPIPTRDYYAMAGILRNARLLKHANVSEWLEFPLPVEPAQEETLRRHEAAIAALEAEIASAKESAKKLAAGPGAVGGTGSSPAMRPSVVPPNQLPGLVVDSAQAKAVGHWKHSTYSRHYIGDGYLHDDQQSKGSMTLSFAPEITKAGRYEVRFAYQPGTSRATQVPVTIFHADGETLVRVNQQEPPLLDGRFVSLGEFRFEANGFGYVLVSNENTRGHVTADAVQFLDAAAPSVARFAKDSAASSRPLPVTPEPKAPDVNTLQARLKQIKETGPKRPKTMGVSEAGPFENTRIHIRGSVHQLGELAPRGFLTLGRTMAPPNLPSTESGRRQLADWIASPAHPLTARVYANRVWLWLFGEGLVRSPDNFGITGEAASHPELLDYLAARLIQHGWSTKQLVREIVLSRTYQQASSHPSRNAPRSANSADSSSSMADPENRLLRHAHRRRLTAEALRDAILTASGGLRLAGGGPAYPATLTADFGYQFTGAVRSVYVPVFRNALPGLFEAFDFPSPGLVTGKRSSSTVVTQALFLLNDPWVRSQARAAARRTFDAASDNPARVRFAYRATLGRSPKDAEQETALRHLEKSGEATRDEAWTELLHALIASGDFRYLD